MPEATLHPAMPATRADLARMIDHTILRPDATRDAILRLCDECVEHGFIAACVQPVWVAACATRLAGSQSLVCTVVGFPHGANTSRIKALEAAAAVKDGAREVDMVIHHGDLLGSDPGAVERDIRTVVESAKSANDAAQVKVILETAPLPDDRIIAACRAAALAGADFIKTSTGFHAAGGATEKHVALLRSHSASASRTGGRMLVKASGGIRDIDAARRMIAAGADRLGTSASVSILAGLNA